MNDVNRRGFLKVLSATPAVICAGGVTSETLLFPDKPLIIEPTQNEINQYGSDNKFKGRLSHTNYSHVFIATQNGSIYELGQITCLISHHYIQNYIQNVNERYVINEPNCVGVVIGCRQVIMRFEYLPTQYHWQMNTKPYSDGDVYVYLNEPQSVLFRIVIENFSVAFEPLTQPILSQMGGLVLEQIVLEN